MAIEHLVFHQTSFDTVHVPHPERPQVATFFDVSPYPYIGGSSPITEFDEKPLVRFTELSRVLIFEQLGLSADAWYRPEVVQPFYAAGEGDIDLILCPPLAPLQAFALECKRVKVEAVNAGQDRINKLHGVAGGVHQANALYNWKFGFFQTWLCILTEVEASQDERNFPNRGVRSHTTPQKGDTGRTTFRQIVEFPGRENLHRDIGIVFVEIVQPQKLSIDRQATVRVCAYRRAECRDQLDSVTKRLMEIIR